MITDQSHIREWVKNAVDKSSDTFKIIYESSEIEFSYAEISYFLADYRKEDYTISVLEHHDWDPLLLAYIIPERSNSTIFNIISKCPDKSLNIDTVYLIIKVAATCKNNTFLNHFQMLFRIIIRCVKNLNELNKLFDYNVFDHTTLNGYLTDMFKNIYFDSTFSIGKIIIMPNYFDGIDGNILECMIKALLDSCERENIFNDNNNKQLDNYFSKYNNSIYSVYKRVYMEEKLARKNERD